MKKTDFDRAVRQILVLYGSGQDYSCIADTVVNECSDRQWEQMERYIDEADETEVDYGLPQLSQLERVNARRQSRDSRYPGVLARGVLYPEEEAERRIKELEREYQLDGATFRTEDDRIVNDHQRWRA